MSEMLIVVIAGRGVKNDGENRGNEGNGGIGGNGGNGGNGGYLKKGFKRIQY